MQSSDWPFRSSNAPKNYGTGLDWSVCSILLGLCVPSASERSWSSSFCVLQVASEKAELSAALIEYEKDINLLESLYNNNKALFDQHELDADLKELAEYASRLPFAAGTDQRIDGRSVLRDLDEWLNSINPNLGKKKRPGLNELWKSGDLREKLAAVNAKISSIRTRWQVPRALRFRRRTLLTTTTTRCDFKSAHSYRRTWSLGDWTLFTLTRQLSSNRYPPCSNR